MVRARGLCRSSRLACGDQAEREKGQRCGVRLGDGSDVIQIERRRAHGAEKIRHGVMEDAEVRDVGQRRGGVWGRVGIGRVGDEVSGR